MGSKGEQIQINYIIRVFQIGLRGRTDYVKTFISWGGDIQIEEIFLLERVGCRLSATEGNSAFPHSPAPDPSQKGRLCP